MKKYTNTQTVRGFPSIYSAFSATSPTLEELRKIVNDLIPELDQMSLSGSNTVAKLMTCVGLEHIKKTTHPSEYTDGQIIKINYREQLIGEVRITDTPTEMLFDAIQYQGSIRIHLGGYDNFKYAKAAVIRVSST